MSLVEDRALIINLPALAESYGNDGNIRIYGRNEFKIMLGKKEKVWVEEKKRGIKESTEKPNGKILAKIKNRQFMQEVL